MVKHLLDQIISPNVEFKIEVKICRSSYLSTFVKSSTYLSTVVTIIYSSANPSSGRFRKVSIYDASRGDHGVRRSVSFNGRGCGRGRGGRCG